MSRTCIINNKQHDLPNTKSHLDLIYLDFQKASDDLHTGD